MNQVLITDSSGTPREWCDHQTGVNYYVRGKVLWETGATVKVFTGGKNMHGEISKVAVSAILGVSGPVLGETFKERETVYADRPVVYGRDRHTCCYCGNVFPEHRLTMDHVTPKSHGGLATWMNMVAACKPCNTKKANRTPEEAKMHLLFVPYVPNMFEKMLLKGRNVLGDQMEFLMARIPKTSRCWKN